METWQHLGEFAGGAASASIAFLAWLKRARNKASPKGLEESAIMAAITALNKKIEDTQKSDCADRKATVAELQELRQALKELTERQTAEMRSAYDRLIDILSRTVGS